MNAIRVVVRPVREDLKGAERVALQRAVAREALALSAREAGAVLGPLAQDESGAPLPSNGWHWSVTHAGAFAAGVVCRAPVGLDVARIEPRDPGIVPRVTSRDELELLGGFDWAAFARVWSAKEAVLKKAGCGLGELSRCVLVAVPDDATMVLAHRDRHHVVRQIVFAEHLAAVSHDWPRAGAADTVVEWLHGAQGAPTATSLIRLTPFTALTPFISGANA